jgi:hypothetical protein
MRTRTETLFIGESQNFSADGCYAISFFRPDSTVISTNPVSVNGVPIAAGNELTIGQNVGDEDWSNYSIVFTAGANSNELHVIRIMPVRS